MSRKNRQECISSSSSPKDKLSRRVKLLNDKYHKKNYETKKNELEIKNKLTELTRTVKELTKKVENLSKSDKSIQDVEEQLDYDYAIKFDIDDNRNKIKIYDNDNVDNVEYNENFRKIYNPYDKRSYSKSKWVNDDLDDVYDECKNSYDDVYGVDVYDVLNS